MFEGPGGAGLGEYEQKREKAKAKDGPALWVDDDDWTEADIPCRPWVVPGYALRGSVTVLCGPPSAMKSSLVLAWGCSLAIHHAFGRFTPLPPGKMLIYNVEDDRLEQRRRLSATLRQFPGATPESIKGKVIRTGPEQIGTLLSRSEDGRIVFTSACSPGDGDREGVTERRTVEPETVQGCAIRSLAAGAVRLHRRCPEAGDGAAACRMLRAGLPMAHRKEATPSRRPAYRPQAGSRRVAG